ncbi:MAG: hypothetical protein WCS42_23075 [Verrucomicrobiota bacterium]
MNRLRADVFNKITVRTAFGDGVWPIRDSLGDALSSEDDPKKAPGDEPFAKVSGPWPLSGPNPFSGKQGICYPDTGDTEEAKMSRWLYATWGSFGDDEYRNYYVVNKNFINLAGVPSPFSPVPTEGRFAVGLMKSKRKFAIIISGDSIVHCHGVIIIPVAYLQRGYTSSAGSQPIYDTASIFDLIEVYSTLPVAVEKIKDYRPLDDDQPIPAPHFAEGRFSALVWRLNRAIDPGRYEITLTVPDQGDDQSNFHYTLQADGSGWNEVQNYTDTVVKSRVDITPGLIWNGRFEQPSEEAVEVDGIHDTKAIKCIPLTPIWPAICSVKDSPEVVTMFPAPITASTDGYWLGKTYPIGNCFVPAPNPTSLVRWPANAVVPVGCQIYDATGNIWTCIQAGNTGPLEPLAYYDRLGLVPTWPHTLGAVYEEMDLNSYLPISNPAKWKLTNLVRTRYETPWWQGKTIEVGVPAFFRTVGEICVSRAGDFYQCTKTQMMVDGSWADSPTGIDGLSSSNINALLDEPDWNRAIGSVIRLEIFANSQDWAVEWTSIFHPGPTVNPGPARVGSQMFSYPCIWDEDGWIAAALFNLGRKILEGGRIWVCSNGGQTGSIKPDFSGETEVADGTAKWQLESKVNYFSSESGSRYPLAAAAASGLPQKWWIRQLFLNRVVHGSPIWSAGAMAGSVGGGFPNASTQSIPVEIGFYRSGAFVLLGHYMTGMQPMVMWPVFTDTPLVYKAGERVDVQASVVRPDDNHQLGFPISAEHYNDMERSLNLL